MSNFTFPRNVERRENPPEEEIVSRSCPPLPFSPSENLTPSTTKRNTTPTMKYSTKVTLISSALACGAVLPQSSQAGGIDLYEMATPDVGLASAGYSARAQDASTLFKNPAGMSLLEGTQVPGRPAAHLWQRPVQSLRTEHRPLAWATTTAATPSAAAGEQLLRRHRCHRPAEGRFWLLLLLRPGRELPR